MRVNEAISIRITELLKERRMTKYRLYKLSGIPKSTISNIINCSYDTVTLRILHEMCQGLDISITEFFDSPLFAKDLLDD